MNLLGGITLDRAWLDDPLILTWALARAMDERELELPREQCAAAGLFDAATIRRLLDVHEPAQRAQLFTSLPPASLAPLTDQLVAYWPEADPEEVSELAGALVQVNPDLALKAFADSLKLGARTTRLERLFGIGVGLCQLAPRGANLVGPFINAVQTARLEMQLESPAILAVIHGRADARHFLSRWSDATGLEVFQDAYELLSPDGMFDLVLSHRDDPEICEPLQQAARAFRPDAPLDQLARALEGKRLELPVGQSVGAARALPHFAREAAPLFYVAAVLDSWLLRELDVSAFSAKQVLDHLAVDLPRHMHRAALAARLKALPRDQVLAAFEERRSQRHGNYSGQHLAWAAGQLADPALIPFLVGLWDERPLYAASEEAMDSLARIGAPSVPPLIERTDCGDARIEALACGALALIEGQASEDALASVLEESGADAPEWPIWLPRRPVKRLVDLLAAERDDVPYDDAAVLIQLALLHAGPVPDEDEDAPAARPARAEQTGRNDPCPCGSGKKYKKCCLDK